MLEASPPETSKHAIISSFVLKPPSQDLSVEEILKDLKIAGAPAAPNSTATRQPIDLQADADAMKARIERGIATQFADVRSGPVVDIVVGLDFGTSTTKVIVRAPYFAGVSPHVLPILPALQAEENAYLWKTALWVNPSGEFLPTGNDEGAVRIEDIKQNLTGGKPQGSIGITRDGRAVCAWEAAIAYLAIVFRYTRGWFLESKSATYRRLPLSWQTNIGLPAATYDDPQLVSLYRRTSAAAWLLSQEPGPISLSAVQSIIDDPRAIAASRDVTDTREEIGVEVVPEVAAEVVGFARSTRRREGLYALVDVGGGTLDVCTFRLH